MKRDMQMGLEAEERSAACEKEYANGIGAMPVEKRTEKNRAISETLKAKYSEGGAIYVADPFKAYLDRQAVSHLIMRYKNDPKISRFQVSQDKVGIYIIFLRH